MSERAVEQDGALVAAALRAMRGPAQMGIICVDISNKCDLHCSNCTRLLANQDGFHDMSLDNFRAALRSLREHPGVVAVIGGNPCMHRDFEGICEVLREEIPDKSRRGLWTNNVFKHAELARETFGVFNLNAHDDARGLASLEPLKDLGWYYTGHSEHSSILAAVRDFHAPREMWQKISRCDINQNWSASIVENGGRLRAYFCEVAASFDLARGEDHGVEVVDGWWRRPLSEFEAQVRHFCPGCGVPARLAPLRDDADTDSYSASNADLALKSAERKKRRIVEIRPESGPLPAEHPVTQYSNNLRQAAPAPTVPPAPQSRPGRRRIAVVTPYYREPLPMLRQCVDSVRAQIVDADVVHILVADGHGLDAVAAWGVEHIRLPRSHANNGNTPRAVGAMLAEAEGADFIAFLDADNWFHSIHLASLLALHDSSHSPVCCAWRTFHRPDGSQIGISEQDEDRLAHVDTSCFLLHSSAFELNRVWSRMPEQVSPICDRVFFKAALQARWAVSFTRQRTVAFRTTYACHYIGEAPPPEGLDKAAAQQRAQAYLLSADGVRETVGRLGFWPTP